MIIIEETRWSYSRVNNFSDDGDGCKYAWMLNYILRKREHSEDNAFSYWGTAYHKLIEKYLKNELFAFELIDEYLNDVNQCPYDFPPNPYVDLREKTLNGILEHLEDMSWVNDYEILSIEEPREFRIDGIPFIAISDLEVKEKSTGKLAICDHKISKTFNKRNMPKKLRQLYVYSYPFKEVYGQYPDYLIFNFFKDNHREIIEFDINEYNKTIDWLKNKIELINKETDFRPRCLDVDKNKDFYSKYLCNYRNWCKYRVDSN